MKPTALLYCQHSLGLGHFVRSLALAQGIAEHFDLTFINGGPVPEGKALPDNIDFEHLLPLRMAEDGTLEGDGDVETIFAERRARLLALAAALKPSLLIIELYPFGRKKFAVEIDPLIAAVRAGGGKIACSVRDVLVKGRVDQAQHDDRAAKRLNAQFDLVLVHSDERIFALDESFYPQTAVTIPVRHTGYVVHHAASAAPLVRAGATLVTAGGGAVGQTLYAAAVDAQPLLWDAKRWPMTIVAGPLFPETGWTALQARAKNVAGLTLHRAVPDMKTHLSSAGRVVSQCGYNSALEIAQSAVPALYVPFARGQESEQTMRAERFKALGLCEWMAEDGLDGPALAGRLLALSPGGSRQNLDMNGAATSAQMLRDLAA
jgi:predicted glycosyltransferase